MKFSITPYNNPPQGKFPMKPWPSLAGKASCLTNVSRPGETLFFFDSAPPGYAAPSGESASALSNSPLIVLIHGLGDEADSWRHIIPLLNARGYRVLALDLPGFGRSLSSSKISVKNHTAAVIQLIEAVAPKCPVYLAGNSMGAMIAEMAAFKKPELVRGLILISGSVPGGPSNPGFLALAKLLFSRKWYRSYSGQTEKAWASLYPYYADLDNMPADDKDFLKERVMARVESPTQEKAFFATQRSLIWAYIFAAVGFARKIRKYPGEILLIWGEKDRIIPLSSTKVFMALRSDIKLEIIPGAGHLPQQEKPEETARFIVDFLEKRIFDS